MLYGLLRAFLASFLPLLPIFLHAGKLDDWNHSLSSTFIPRYLPFSGPNSISNHTYNLAQELDYAISAESLGTRATRPGTTHPLFEALAAISHRLFSGLSIGTLWELLLEILLFLILLAVWKPLRPASHGTHPDRRRSRQVSGQAAHDSGNPSRYLPSFAVAIPDDCPRRLLNQEPTLLSSCPSLSGVVPVESPPTQVVHQLLRSWYEDFDATEVTSTPGGSPRPRSLSDIAEQSEPEDSDAESGTASSYYSTSSDFLRHMTPSTIRDWLPKSLREPATSPTSIAKLLSGRVFSDETVVEKSESPTLQGAASPVREEETRGLSPSLVLSSSADHSIAVSVTPTSSASSLTGCLPSATPRAPGSRSRRASSVLVCRAGMPGQQVILTSEGIEYAALQLQESASTIATSREERRRLDRVVSDAAAVFSEDRGTPRPWSAVRRERECLPFDATPIKAPLNIIDGQAHRPLASCIQSRRQLHEVGRSRSGTGSHPTPMVFLERNKRVEPDTSSAPVTPLPPIQLVSGITATATPGAAGETLGVRDVFTRTGRTLSYAEAAAKPAVQQAARPRQLSEQPHTAILSGPKRRALTGGSPMSPFTPRRPSLVDLRAYASLTPTPRSRHATSLTPNASAGRLSQATLHRQGRTKSWRTRHTSESANWRGARTLPANDELNVECARPPPPLPAAFVSGVAQHGPRLGSLLSATGQAQLGALLQLASQRKDIVPPPVQATTVSPNRPDEDEQDDEVVLFRERRCSKDVVSQHQESFPSTPSAVARGMRPTTGTLQSRPRIVIEDDDSPNLDDLSALAHMDAALDMTPPAHPRGAQCAQNSSLGAEDTDVRAAVPPYFCGTVSASSSGSLGLSGSCSGLSLMRSSESSGLNAVSSGRLLASAATLRVDESELDGSGDFWASGAPEFSASGRPHIGERPSGNCSELRTSPTTPSVARSSGPHTVPAGSCLVLRQQPSFSGTVAPLTPPRSLLRLIEQRADPVPRTSVVR
ncbi:hypothetical protein OH77DRAFT_1058251 [Trametes cingulata]|nr:hypothetical protein OH77DRAFT_1058251 [Trametes cingulata]